MATKLGSCSDSSSPERTLHLRTLRLKARHRSWLFPAKTLLMGIINLTPDSFSGDGMGCDIKKVLGKARQFSAEGADMIDIGAVSSRPLADFIPESLESKRLLPCLKALREDSDIPISVDTTRSRVAEQALGMGCDFINDISGLTHDPDMAAVVRDYSAGVIIMHSRGDAKTMQTLTGYEDVIEDICEELGQRLEAAREAGIGKDYIVVDPGIGFAKDAGQNFEIMARLAAFHRFGRPVLLGPSRKSFIGSVTQKSPEERIFGTVAACSLAVQSGVQILRVHDVAAVRDAVRVTEEVMKRGEAHVGSFKMG